MLSNAWWGFYGAGRRLLRIFVMSSHTVVHEHVCYELRRPVMSAVRLLGEEGLHRPMGAAVCGVWPCVLEKYALHGLY